MTRVDPRGAPQLQPDAAASAPCADKPPIVVGIGHDYRRDDAVGLVVARALAAHRSLGQDVYCLGEDVLSLLNLMQPETRVLIIDAVVSGAAPGTIHHIDLLRGMGRHGQPVSSSHVLALAQVLALASTLGRTPAVLRLIGVEAADVSAGQGLTAPVAASAAALIGYLSEKPDFC